MTLSHVVFNTLLDLIYDQCYGKTTSFCFTFVLVNVNPIILLLVLKITCCKHSSETTGHFPRLELLQVLVAFPYNSISEKCRFEIHNIFLEV